MERRKSIGLIGIGSFFFTNKVFPSISGPLPPTVLNEGFIKAFAPRWEGLRTHTMEVLEAMPEAYFDFRPTEDVMSFAKLFSHIGKSLDIYAGILDGISLEDETESNIKGEILTYLRWFFSRFDKAMAQLNPQNLYTPSHNLETRDGGVDFSDYDIIMLAYNHTVHHKGQATTYLRLKGITPPQYRF